MAEGTNGNQVSMAFNLVLDELQKGRESLLKDLATAAERGDFDAVAELTSRLKRVDLLAEEIRRLQSEWEAISNPTIPETCAQAPLEVPDQYELCHPTLQALRVLGGEGKIRDIAETVIRQMQLPDEVTQQLDESTFKPKLEEELGWARTILKTCGLINNPQPGVGVWVLTEEGYAQQPMEADDFKRLYRKYLQQRRQRPSS